MDTPNSKCSSYFAFQFKNERNKSQSKENERMFALRPHTHRSILRAAGHIILTPANQLLVLEQILWTLSEQGLESAAFRSLAKGANHLRYLGQHTTGVSKYYGLVHLDPTKK
jgi:hypothetical protein